MLWIVGKSFSGFRQYLEDHGIQYGIFWDAELPLPNNIHTTVIELDFKDTALSNQLDAHKELDVSAVIVAGYENYVLAAAYIAKYFNIPGPSPAAAIAATDKAVMRQAFLRYNPALTPAFAAVSSWADIEQFMQTHAFPVMLKPASLMKSLLITKNNDLAELQRNYEDTRRAISALYDKHSISQPSNIVIEEFMSGTMHTVAAFVDAQGEPQIVSGVVDCVTGQEAGFQDNFLYCRTLPSKLTDTAQAAVIAAAKEAVHALGLRSCPAHIEIMLTENGPKIIEVGARIGGYRPRMYAYARGLDLHAAQLAVAYGDEPALTPGAQRSVAVFELFPDQEGSYAGIACQDELLHLPSLRHFKVKPVAGTAIGRASQGYRAVGVVILGNDDAEQFARDCALVQQKVRVQLA